VSGTAIRPALLDCGRVQLRVIGALIVRELHSRYGRHRFGYVMMFIEPMLLAIAIRAMHHSNNGPVTRTVFEFYAIGYVLFFMWRAMVTRGSAVIEGGRNLLYHQRITLLDLFFARHLIEVISAVGVMIIFYTVLIAFGSDYPASIIQMIEGVLLMGLLGQGLAFNIANLVQRYEMLDRFVHMAAYITLPISGMLYLVDTLPPAWQAVVMWVPMANCFEFFREGQFGGIYKYHYDIGYLLIWILSTHLLGLAGLRITRHRLGLE